MNKITIIGLCLLFLCVASWIVYITISPRSEQIEIFNSVSIPEGNTIKLNLDLNYVHPGWQILIGDKNKNIDLKDETIKIKFQNTGQDELYFISVGHGDVVVKPNEQKEWFTGKLSQVWDGQTIIWVQNYQKNQINLLFEIEFLDEPPNIKTPLKIFAAWSDNM